MRNSLRSLFFLAATCWSFSSLADPINVVLSDPATQPTFIGYTATLPIHLEPTVTGGTVTGLSGEIRPVGIYNVRLVGHTCPGTMTEVGLSNIQWTGMGSLVNGAAIDCSVELRPQTYVSQPFDMSLRMACNGCTNDADDRDTATIVTALAPDVEATILSAQYPSVGPSSLTVKLVNRGEANAINTPVALFGPASLFSSMTPTGIGSCITNFGSTADSRTWNVALLRPNETLTCGFTFNIPAAGSYELNLAAPATNEDGIPEPELDNNYDTLTLTATSLVVTTRAPVNADANPGDGICDDGLGNCSLRTAVDEANALPGRQVISVPYHGAGYFLNSVPGYLTITDPVTIAGVPDAATGNYPVITRDGSQNAGLIRINTGSTTETVLQNLDLRGDSDNQLSVDGAVIQQFSGGLWIQQSRISNGWTSGQGGGIYGTEYLRLSDVEIFDNVAGTGGGLAMLGTWTNSVPDAFLVGVSIHDNQAANGGGAYFFGADTLIERSSFVDNSADYGGGLMVTTQADVRINNSTISGNEATLRGGGIYHSQGEVLVNFSTVVYNVAGPGDNSSGDGGGIWSAGATLTDIANSILAFNTARTTGGMFGLVVSGNCHGTLDSLGFNTIAWINGDPDCSVFLSNPNDSYNLSPSLAPLEITDIGVGFHRLTRVNREIDQAGYQCVDTEGSPNNFDILRFPRPREGDGIGEAICDRGAVETPPMALHIATDVSGPADWQILLDGDRAPCADIACSYYFIPVGSQITLTPDPALGSSFNGWGGDCSGTGNCVLQMSEWRYVDAAFSAVAQTLTVNKVGSGTVISNPARIDCGNVCSAEFAQGSMVLLTATPSNGFVFDSWSGACSGSGACLVTMDGARTVTATFSPLWELSVTRNGQGAISSSPGDIECPSLTCEDTFVDGTVVTLTATPSFGYVLGSWSGDCSGMGACVVQMDQARNVTANFVEAVRLYAYIEGNGTVTSSPAGIDCSEDCAAWFVRFSDVALTATAAPGYVFDRWSQDCSGNGACAVSMVGDRSVTAHFLPDDILFANGFD